MEGWGCVHTVTRVAHAERETFTANTTTMYAREIRVCRAFMHSANGDKPFRAGDLGSVLVALQKEGRAPRPLHLL